MTQPGASDTPTRWKVCVEFLGPIGQYSLCYHGCEGNTADEAIDYALELVGDRRADTTATEAWAAPEAACSPRVRLSRIRHPAFKREVPR